MIYLDFETRSACNLKKAGAFLYAQHPSTSVMCMAYTFDDEECVSLWHPGFADQTPLLAKTKRDQALPARDLLPQPRPNDLLSRIGGGEICVEAHNSFFERCIWHFQMVLKFGWPKIRFEQWRCSAAKAASYGMPRRLEHLAGKEGLNVKQSKDMGGHRIMLKLSQPRKPTKTGPQPEWHQNREELIELFSYCVGDVRAERAVSQKLRELPPDELRMWRLNQKTNARGIHIDRDLCEAALAIAEEYREDAAKTFERLTDGVVTKHTQGKRMKEWLATQGVMADSLAKEPMVELLKTTTGTAHEALSLWSWANKTSTAKYSTMLNCIADDDRVRDYLMYHGAHTGRESGKKIQPHNFPRNCPKDIDDLVAAIKAHEPLDKWGNPIEAVSRALRGAITAAPGKDLISMDYSAIEARGTFWISGHEEGLEAFRAIDAGEWPGQDIYTWQASKMYGRLITKDDDKERQSGKVAVLGCGYQMGGPRLVEYAEPMGIELDEDEAEKIVADYRYANKPVVDFWGDVEKCCIRAVRQKGTTVKSGFLEFKVHGRFLYIRLPSGRCMAYYRPSLKMVTVHPRPTRKNPDPEPFDKLGLRYWSEYKASRFGWVSTYGGKLTENIFQALCRDIMRDAMFRCDEAGYPIVLTVHDEIVAEVPKGFGSLEEFRELLKEVPAWAPGFPIDADGYRATRYRKG